MHIMFKVKVIDLMKTIPSPKEKLTRYLLSRGYEYSLIQIAFYKWMGQAAIIIGLLVLG